MVPVVKQHRFSEPVPVERDLDGVREEQRMAGLKNSKHSADPSEEPKVDLTPHPLVARLNPHGDPLRI